MDEKCSRGRPLPSTTFEYQFQWKSKLTQEYVSRGDSFLSTWLVHRYKLKNYVSSSLLWEHKGSTKCSSPNNKKTSTFSRIVIPQNCTSSSLLHQNTVLYRVTTSWQWIITEGIESQVNEKPWSMLDCVSRRFAYLWELLQHERNVLVPDLQFFQVH